MMDLDELLGAAAKGLRFENVGDTYTGVVDRPPETSQATEYESGKPRTFDDGTPRMQVRVTLRTDLREDADDDGLRSVYVPCWGSRWKAFRAACAQAGGAPRPGDTFTATFTGMGENPRGGFPPKLFTYRIDRASADTASVADGDAPPWEKPATAGPTTSDAGMADLRATPTGAAVEKARKLIATGLLDDRDIAAATGLAPLLVRRLREGH